MFYRIDMKKPPEKCEITVKIALFGGVSSSLPISEVYFMALSCRAMRLEKKTVNSKVSIDTG
jgi:hypothetical protein